MSTFSASPPRRHRTLENPADTAILRKHLLRRPAESPLDRALLPGGTQAARRSGQEEIRLGKGKRRAVRHAHFFFLSRFLRAGSARPPTRRSDRSYITWAS